MQQQLCLQMSENYEYDTTKIMPIATLAVAGGSEGESGDKATGVGA